MALQTIPTGVLPGEIVEVLPQTGEENKVYRRLVEDEELREMQITDDFIWHDGKWIPFSFDAKIFGAYFAIFQNSLSEKLTDLENRIEALEGNTETIVDVTDYVAPNNTATDIINAWSIASADLSVTADNVVLTDKNGNEYESEVTYAYKNKQGEKVGYIAIYVDPVGVFEEGIGVWLYPNSDGTKFTSVVSSEGNQENMPTTISFGRLILKQEA